MLEVIIIATLLIAGFLRGYTGFGFSALVILVLSSFYPVAEMVPAVLLLDLIISLPLVARSWQQTDLQKLSPLLWATGLGVPFGYLLLSYLPDPILKLVVPGAILVLALMTHSQNRITQWLSRSAWLCGFMSGWTTSAVSAGGAPVVIYMRQSNLPLAEQRHCLISYFFLTTCLVVGCSYSLTRQWHLLPDRPVVYGLAALSALLIGQWAQRKTDHPLIHHVAFYLMLSLSAISLLRALWML
ncbi:TSUP family transporter [Vibrio sp. WXL103]|uniref:TSUP family transporter n=1 Tax=unclassified Vibrio TaxID=2614977 RepID=UPI003EC7638C